MHTIFGFVLALSATMVLMPLLMRWAGPLHFLDQPDARKVHAAPVPRVGGIAMAGGIVAALLLWGEHSRGMLALSAGMLILLCFGVWDDRHSLSAGPKFVGQALAAAVVICWGGIRIATLTLSERVVLPEWIAIPLTFMFLMGGTNAFNLADGLDGLAGGMAMLCFCGAALLAFTVGNYAVGTAALVMIGAILGFLRFNTHPARAFMGDGGSQVLGFAAAAMVVMLTQDPQVPLSSALPLLLLGLPIIDTLKVMTERLLARQSPFRADRRHMHHGLLELGFEHWEAVSLLYLLQGAFFVAAWFLRFESDLHVLAVFALIGGAALLSLLLAQQSGLRVRGIARPVRVADGLETRWMAVVAEALLAVALAAYALWVLATGARPAADVRWLALALGAMLGLSTAIRWQRPEVSWLEKSALYSAAALALYLSHRGFADAAPPSLAEWIVFPVMALAVAVSMRMGRDQAFKLTPLDILVLLVVITVPNLPDSVTSARAMGWAVTELVVLFYAIEALSCAPSARHRWLRLAASLFLLGLAL